MTMTTTCIDSRRPDPNRVRDVSHTSGLTGWIHLAAAPTFAMMALLNLLAVAPVGMLCSAGLGMSSLGGMTLMYALMGVFHASPWLEMISGMRSRVRGHRASGR